MVQALVRKSSVYVLAVVVAGLAAATLMACAAKEETPAPTATTAAATPGAGATATMGPMATPTTAATPKPKVPVVARLNLGTEPPTLDPALSVDNVSIDMAGSLFVGLTQVDEATSAIKPDLAKSWDVSPDGTTYTFHLRDDVLWSDGKKVTAHDAVYGILRTLDPATASEYAYVSASIIKGAAAFNAGDTTDASLVGVRAIDDYTLEITLKHAAGYFPSIASMWVLYPQPRWAIEAYGAEWIEAGNIVTSGAYMLDSWEHEQSLVLVKNPNYYDADNVQIDRLEFVMVNEASTAMAMYEAGELDSLYQTGVPLEDIDRVKADPMLSKEFFVAPELTTYYYGFNNTKPPMDNPLVRRAFSAAIDRQTLVDKVTKGGQKPARTFAPPGIFGAVDGDKENIGIAFDPVKARAWLAEAGYPGGAGLPEIVLMYNTSEGHKKIAEAIQAMWKEHLGVTVTIQNQEWAVYLSTLQTDPPHIYRLGWGADYPDSNNWLNEVFNSKSDSNYAKYSDPEYDRLVEEAAQETLPEKRLALYRQAEKLLTETDAAIAPIYFYTTVQLTKPSLVRTYSPFGAERFQHWVLTKK